jgi:hypothetical protein
MSHSWRANLGKLAKCGGLTKQVQALMATELRRRSGMRIAMNTGCRLPPVEAGNGRVLDSQIDASSEEPDAVPELLPPSRGLVPAPIGAAPEHVRAWFNNAVEASEPIVDGTCRSSPSRSSREHGAPPRSSS